jgi:hypothetical protein
MAKYLLLKHYRGAPASVNDVPMDQWTPEEISAHVQYMHDFAARRAGYRPARAPPAMVWPGSASVNRLRCPLRPVFEEGQPHLEAVRLPGVSTLRLLRPGERLRY